MSYSHLHRFSLSVTCDLVNLKRGAKPKIGWPVPSSPSFDAGSDHSVLLMRLDFQCGRFGLTCGRFGCGRFGLWPFGRNSSRLGKPTKEELFLSVNCPSIYSKERF